MLKMHTNVLGMVIPLAKPTQRWLYDVASSGYFGGLAMATMAILGAEYVAASLGIGRHESHAGQMLFNCSHPLVFVKTISSMGWGCFGWFLLPMLSCVQGWWPHGVWS